MRRTIFLRALSVVATVGLLVCQHGEATPGQLPRTPSRPSAAPADAATPATASVATLGGCPVFPADSPWNTSISSASRHPDSDAILANIDAHGPSELHADFGSSHEWGIPFVVAPATQPPVPVRFTEYPDECDPGPYPIPPDAPVEFGNDHHVLVLQSGACRLFELYHARRNGRGWDAGAGAVFDLRSNASRPRGWTSCDQAGLPILPGLVRFDEVQQGEIRHALRFTVDHTRNRWIPPANHPGGEDDPHAPAMGMRFRLRSSIDVTRFHGASRVILTALQRYGMFLADTGTNWFVSGATDPRWNDDDLHQLASVHGRDFEVDFTGDAVGYH